MDYNIILFSTDSLFLEDVNVIIDDNACQIRRFNSPEAVLQGAEKHPPKAVLLDLSEATDEGFSLARRMQRRHPAVAVIGVGGRQDPDLILRGLRAGLTDYLDADKNCIDLQTALQNALNQQKDAGDAAGILAVFSLKGGQGVTNVAVNLADQLQALTGRRVLLMDMNLYRGDTGVYLNQACTFTLYDLLRERLRMDERLLFSSIVHHKNRFYLLGTPETISDADRIGREEIEAVLEMLRPHFAYIVVDMSPDLSDKNLALFDAADRILLTAQQTLPEIKSTLSALEFFRELYSGNGKTDIIVNRYQKDLEITKADLENIFDHPVTATLVNDYRTVCDAVKAGKTVCTAHPKSKLSKDFRTLAAGLAGFPSAPSPKHLLWRLTGALSGRKRP